MNIVKKRFLLFKGNLTSIKKKEPLGKLSLLVIIFLDIFVLSVIFKGLAEHTSQLTTLWQYAPQTCQEAFINQTWTPITKIDKLQHIILYDNYHHRSSSTLDVKRMHPKCQEFYKSVELIEADSLLMHLFGNRKSLQRESDELNKRATRRKPVTDNTLLTDISQGNRHKPHSAITAKNKADTDKLEILTSQLDKIDKDIQSNQKVKVVFGVIDSWDEQQLQKFVSDIDSFEKWYKFRQLAWEMLFLIPLFLLFYLWNHRSIKKENGLQVLISTHLLVVIVIPIFIKILHVVLELIPQHFFKKLFETLSSLHIMAIWHYILILLAIFLAIFLIYIIQKKLFNNKRLQQKRLSNSCCIECGKKLPTNVKICPFCGMKQVDDCPECKEETYICGDFCINCGAKKEK